MHSQLVRWLQTLPLGDQQTPAEFYAGTKTNVDRKEVPKRVA